MQWNWKERREKSAFLALADGSVFRGWSFGAAVDRLGEVVFNTGMTGYEEILTDPSYSGQIVALTAAEIGNTGWNCDDEESSVLRAEGLIVNHCSEPSNFRSQESLHAKLAASGTPALAGIDVRSLTMKLREAGTLRGFICATGAVPVDEAIDRAREWQGLDGVDYATKVSTKEQYLFAPDSSWGLPPPVAPDMSVVAYDFGIKRNILRSLQQRGMRVNVVPAATTAKEILAMRPDGVFLSNGPGDPSAVKHAVENIRELIGKVPLMGICLGHQLLALSLGGVTRRMKFGHHGCNHPVKDLRTGEVEITSQNHNFVVEASSIQTKAEPTHINLNDGTLEGLCHNTEPVFSVQYHPEAAPGPHDSRSLFDRFRKFLENA